MNAPSPPHPTDQILYDYGLGKLGDPDASEVDSHLEACDACRQRVSELSGDSFVGRLRDAGARPDTPAPGPAPSGRAKKADGPSNPASVPSPDPDLAGTLPPELADNRQYQVLRELGRGGMGVVYLARNTLMDRLEVLKVLNKEMLEREGAYDRFLREVRAAARLSHPNVVGAYSAVQIGRLLVFAMEYVEGADLSQVVKSRGPLPVAHACSFIHQAALGLQHAHERGMVHRDIKPANLMLTRQGQRGIVKILDFGLAKASSENPIDGGLTREGQMLGTADYIAPEQSLDAQKADIRADIYCLGCTLYYLLTGCPPFQGKSLYEILQAHHTMEARPLNLVRPEVPVELAAVVGKMMAKEREWRYQTPAEVAEALKPYWKGGKARSNSSDAERPRVMSPVAVPAAVAVVSPPAEPTPGAEVPVAAKGAVPSIDPSLRWDSLIAIPKPEGLTQAKVKSAAFGMGRPWPRWMRPTLKAGAVLVLVIACAAGLVSLRRAEVRPILTPVPQPKLPDGFVALFNGKDLRGWKTHPSQPGNWRVENGILIGSGPRANGRISYLYSDRDDFKDFHLRVEARIHDDGNSGVYFRSTYGPAWPVQAPWHPLGYEARIKLKHGISDYTGSLFATADGLLGNRRESHISQFEFFTLEVIAKENHIVVRVNGRTTADYIDPRRRYMSGHIALQQLESSTVVEFRKIDIKELPESAREGSRPQLITNSIGMKLVLIPAGEFLMGSPDSDSEATSSERPQHKVWITPPFYLGATEVTQGQYRAVTGQSPSSFKGSNDLPMANVSWNDAIAFCNKLGAREGAIYRLPTEAEWEYACRAGSKTRYCFGDGEASLDDVAWFNGNSGIRSHPVGQKRPNAWGLYDMHGNVREWCWDLAYKSYSGELPRADPVDPSQAALQAVRGGCFYGNAWLCRSACRLGYAPDYQKNNLGFSLVRVPSAR